MLSSQENKHIVRELVRSLVKLACVNSISDLGWFNCLCMFTMLSIN